MTIRFYGEIRKYTDCEGRNDKWFRVTAPMATMEEAQKMVETTTRNFPETGDWRIVTATMDEATFTYEEKVVKHYNYSYENEFVADMEKAIANNKAIIERLEESKKRCKTTTTFAKKDADIAYFTKRIKDYEQAIVEWRKAHQ